jgi:NitT/TauT family transport system permease protein
MNASTAADPDSPADSGGSGRTRLRDYVGAAAAYLWSGWGPASGILVFAAIWELTAQAVGPLILPAPGEALATLGRLLHDATVREDILITVRRALSGYGLALALGSLAGLLAGLSLTASMLTRPIVTLLVGTPPIAWLILALLWFGAGDGTPVFTVFVAAFPIIFVGAMQGARTLDGELKAMARIFRLPPTMTFTDVYLPHVVSYLFPAWITALGTAWKVVVMAELLATTDGIGAALAVTRSHLDTAGSIAWIVALVGSLLAVEYLFLEPVKRRVESWREVTSSAA